MSQAFPSDTATRSLPLYFAHIAWVKFAHPTHLLTVLTGHACRHNGFWGGRCDSNHPPTISLKLKHFHGDFGTSFRHMTQVLSRHISSLISDHPLYFELFRPYFLQIFIFRQIPTKTNLSRLATQNNLQTNQGIQMFSTTLTVTHKESSFNVKPTKILRLLFVQRSYPEIFFKLWETITCHLLKPNSKFKKNSPSKYFVNF